MAQKENIAVLGCGWLGLPLAKSLIEKGYCVKGSTTTREKLPMLTEAGIEPHFLKLNSSGIEGDLKSFLKGVEILIVNIPPQKDSETPEYLKILIEEILVAEVRNLIYTSSTAVFPDTDPISTYCDDYSLSDGDTGKSARLKKMETMVLNVGEHFDVGIAIVRFGGLIGPDRHPVKYLAGKEGIANPDAPINLIDQKDCIGVMTAIVEKKRFGGSFNAVYPYHPSRKSYYTAKAQELGLAVPQFGKGPSVGKIIDSKRVQEELGYRFQVKP